MGSQTSSLCLQGSQDILTTLEGIEGPEAARMRAEAEELRQAFESWLTNPPEQQQRRTTVSRLFSLYREALLLVGKK